MGEFMREFVKEIIKQLNETPEDFYFRNASNILVNKKMNYEVWILLRVELWHPIHEEFTFKESWAVKRAIKKLNNIASQNLREIQLVNIIKNIKN